MRNAIIFCNRKTTVRELNKSLKRSGFRTGEIHGDMDQPQRLAELELFKQGEVSILVASDVAARGLDIKGVSHVINFDAPWHPDDYVHRVGRTGRAGATGIAYTFVTADDAEHVANIEKLTGQKIDRLQSMPAAAPGDDAPDEPAPAVKSRRGSRKRSADRPAPAPVEARRPEPAATPAPAPRERDQPVESTAAGEWNGPVPAFLDARIQL